VEKKHKHVKEREKVEMRKGEDSKGKRNVMGNGNGK